MEKNSSKSTLFMIIYKTTMQAMHVIMFTCMIQCKLPEII